MGLIRYGDPEGYPDIDIMVRRGVKYYLDSVWRGDWEAVMREEQLTKKGKVVYILDRYAPPEEVKGHFPIRGIPDLNEKVILDGRYTKVYDVWVAIGKRYRKKKIVKSKSKRKISKKR